MSIERDSFDKAFDGIMSEVRRVKNATIFHTWGTHCVHRECADKGEGEILYHTLTEEGVIEFYSVKWEDGTIEENINADSLELTIVQEHRHGPKKKKKKK